MKRETPDDFFESKRDRAKLKHSKHKTKLKPYKRIKYKDYEDYENVQFRCI